MYTIKFWYNDVFEWYMNHHCTKMLFLKLYDELIEQCDTYCSNNEQNIDQKRTQ